MWKKKNKLMKGKKKHLLPMEELCCWYLSNPKTKKQMELGKKKVKRKVRCQGNNAALITHYWFFFRFIKFAEMLV